jgi:hypothetical protein
MESTRLLLDGQQRFTSLSAVIRGEPVEDEEELIDDEADSNEDELSLSIHESQ